MENMVRSPDFIAITDRIKIRQRGKHATYTAEFHLNGMHRRRSLDTNNQRVARQRAMELDRHLRDGDLPSSDAPLLIGTAIDQFISTKQTEGKSVKTIVEYETELRSFAKYSTEKKRQTIQQLNLQLVDSYRKHRREIDQLEPYTQYNHTVILKTFTKWLRRRRLIQSDPLVEMDLRKPRRPRHPAATLKDVNATLGQTQGVLFAVIAVAAFTGLRLGEIVALRKRDVDFESEKGIIHVRAYDGFTPKTDASVREIPIHPRLNQILRAMVPAHNSFFFNPPASAIFPLGDHHLNSRDINEGFKALARKVGLCVGRKNGGLTFHALRRFFKTFTLDAGVPKPMVDAWLGHSDSQSMDHFYYNSTKSSSWMSRVPFGEPSELDLFLLKGKNHEPKAED